MTIIHIIGPNAIGKTTALQRWAAKYGDILTPISLDLLRKPGYDTQEEKAARCAEWRTANGIVVVESARTTQLTLVSCDSESRGVVWRGSERIDKYNWKGTQVDKQAAVRDVRANSALAVCEPTRTTTTSYALPDEPVIIVTCSWETLGRHLRARCEAKGKRFRDDYWDEWKLGYESSRRYLNFAAKNLRPEQVKHFEVNDQARDWPAVDAYFGQVFRRLHNQLVRGR